MTTALRFLRRHLFFVLAAFAVLMASIDATIVAVALPQLTTAFGAPLPWVSATLTAYQIVQVVMLPLTGKLSDSLGRRRVFLFCVGVFTLGSLLCGLAPSIGWLIAFRAVQAIGGGGLLPSAVGIVSDQYRERRAQAIGLFTSAFPIGGIIGPNLGGYIIQHWSWREMFLINVPIGLLVVGGVLVLVGDSADANRRRLHLDLPGLGLYAGAVVALMVGMTAAADDPALWSSPVLWALLVGALALLVLFLRHVRRAADPIMDYQLLASHPFLAANLYNFLFGASVFGLFSFMPYYAVLRYNLTPFESGAVMTPRAVAMIVVSTVASLYVIRLGYRLPMLVGMGLLVMMLALLSQGWQNVALGGLTLHGFWLLALLLLVGGVGMGLSAPSSNNAALDLAPGKAAGMTGVRGMFRLTGGALSVAAIVLALSFFPDQAHGLEVIFMVLAGVLLLTIPLTLAIPDTARERWQREQQRLRQAAADATSGPPGEHPEAPSRPLGAVGGGTDGQTVGSLDDRPRAGGGRSS